MMPHGKKQANTACTGRSACRLRAADAPVSHPGASFCNLRLFQSAKLKSILPAVGVA
jgi:hypothetical protein